MERIERVVDILIADYERQDGHLEVAQVERVLEKRALSVAECEAVLAELEKLGISLSDEKAEQQDIEPDPDSDANIDGDAITSPQALKRFRKGAGNEKLLTGAEEVELGRAIGLGRRAQEEINTGTATTSLHTSILAKASAARKRMILANERLVFYVAHRYFGMSDLPPEDLIQEGTIGLIRAVEKYDHTLGYKFSTYATWWIRQSVTRAIIDRGTLIRLPAHLTLLINRYHRAIRLLFQIHPGRHPSIGELSEELAWDQDKVHFVQQLAHLEPVSMDAPVSGTEGLALVDTLSGNLETPESHLERVALHQAVEQAFDSLKESQRRVLDLRFGIHDQSGGRTLEEVGKILGVTRERIRQIEAQALKSLRKKCRIDSNFGLASYAPAESDDRPSVVESTNDNRY